MNLNHSFLYLLGISTCFIAATAATQTIVGGDKASINEFSYQVSLIVHGHGHDCGGGILNNYHILTAAHCVVKNNGHFYTDRIVILAGTHDVSRLDKTSVIAEVETVYVPTEYIAPPTTGPGDIAVLKLKDPLGLPYFWSSNGHLKPLQLPKNKNETYTGQTAVISGFGWNSICLTGSDVDSGNADGFLRYAEAYILSTQECQRGYVVQRISEKHICAQVKQRNKLPPRGVCNGDSGGPLVHDGKTAIGILSISPRNCTENVRAGIYTRVTDYVDFIHDAMHYKVHHKKIRKHDLA